jgi:hypothetical protein
MEKKWSLITTYILTDFDLFDTIFLTLHYAKLPGDVHVSSQQKYGYSGGYVQMISSLIKALFGIIKLIWNAPTWVVVLVIIMIAVLSFLIGDSGSSSSGGTGESSSKYPNELPKLQFNKPEQPFVFYDYNGDRHGRGDCFQDSKGYYRSWGDDFYDGKGYYRSWGENYYDIRGYFRSWGDCFYDTQGNLVYPNW